MELKRIFKVNGKENNKKEWYRLNKKQVLEVSKDKSRIIYPFKIEEDKIKSNLFFPEGFGKFILTLLLLIGLVLVLYNSHINTQECIEVLNNPEEFCNGVEQLKYGGTNYELGEGYKKISINIDSG
jgi:hypothetical protein